MNLMHKSLLRCGNKSCSYWSRFLLRNCTEWERHLQRKCGFKDRGMHGLPWKLSTQEGEKS